LGFSFGGTSKLVHFANQKKWHADWSTVKETVHTEEEFMRALIITVAALTAACSQPGKVHKTVEETAASNAINREAAKEAEASHFTEVEFKPGSSTLTEASRRSITNLLEKARTGGQLDEVSVLAWADEEYPSSAQKNLPDPQRKLADRRAESVKKYIDGLKYDVDVDSYNMAERPGKVSEWAATKDARFKKTMADAGLPTTEDQRQFPSKASKAVILVGIE